MYRCLVQERRRPGPNCLYYCESSQLIDVLCRAVDLYCSPYAPRLSFQLSGSGEAWQGPVRAPRLNCLGVNGEGEGSEVSSFPAHSSARTHSVTPTVSVTLSSLSFRSSESHCSRPPTAGLRWSPTICRSVTQKEAVCDFPPSELIKSACAVSTCAGIRGAKCMCVRVCVI